QIFPLLGFKIEEKANQTPYERMNTMMEYYNSNVAEGEKRLTPDNKQKYDKLFQSFNANFDLLQANLKMQKALDESELQPGEVLEKDARATKKKVLDEIAEPFLRATLDEGLRSRARDAIEIHYEKQKEIRSSVM